MACNTPGVEVSGPNCDLHNVYGLLAVAEVEDLEDCHWEMGFHHEELSCDSIETRAVNCPPPTDPKDVENAGLNYPVGDAFTLIAPLKSPPDPTSPKRRGPGRSGARCGRSRHACRDHRNQRQLRGATVESRTGPLQLPSATRI